MNETQKPIPREEDEVVIDLLPLLKALWKNVWVIIFAALILGSGAYLVTKFAIAPTYRSSFTAYVNNKAAGSEVATAVTSSDLTASKSLANTYAEILVSRTLLEKAAAEAGIAYDTVSELQKLVTTEVSSDTEIITVHVTTKNASDSLHLADVLAATAPEQIAQIVEGSSMQIIDTPILPSDIYSPNYLKYTLVGMVLGVFLSAGMIVLRELLDNRVKAEEDLEERFGISVIGTVPDIIAASKKGNSGGYYGYGEKQKQRGGRA